MRPRDIEKLLDLRIQSKPRRSNRRKRTLFLTGPPGGGKTTIVIEAALRNKMYIIFFHPLFAEPVDLTGIPHLHLNGVPDNSKTFWASPHWIPDEVPKGYNGILMLIDEMSQCDQAMMKACAPICEEHRVGSKFLPNDGQYGTLVVATGNRAGDRSGANKLLKHVQSRVTQIDFESSLEDFVEWGTKHDRILPVIRYFLQFKPDCLNTFDPAAEGQYACQRGWESVSDDYESTPDYMKSEIVGGTVGKGPAAEFLAFSKVWEELTNTFDVGRILEKPDKAAVPKKDQVDVMYALTGSIAEKAKAADGIKLLTQAIVYFNRLPKEFGFLGVQAMVNHVGKERFQALCKHPEYAKWFKENQELLNEARCQGGN